MNDIKSLIEYGNTAFSKIDDLVDLTDLRSIKAEQAHTVLPKNFVPINQTASDFFLKIKQHNGMIALRRGYYILLPAPKLVPVLDYNVWRMTVLFTEGLTNNMIYKYGCNVGPLVNKFAVCRNVNTKRYINLPERDRGDFLSRLENRAIYVSSSELVHVDDAPKPYDTKEVLWFQW